MNREKFFSCFGQSLFVCAVRLKEIAQGLFMALKSLRFSDVFASHSDVVYFLISCRAWLPFIWRDLDLSARLNSCPATSRQKQAVWHNSQSSSLPWGVEQVIQVYLETLVCLGLSSFTTNGIQNPDAAFFCLAQTSFMLVYVYRSSQSLMQQFLLVFIRQFAEVQFTFLIELSARSSFLSLADFKLIAKQRQIMFRMSRDYNLFLDTFSVSSLPAYHSATIIQRLSHKFVSHPISQLQGYEQPFWIPHLSPSPLFHTQICKLPPRIGNQVHFLLGIFFLCFCRNVCDKGIESIEDFLKRPVIFLKSKSEDVVFHQAARSGTSSNSTLVCLL